MPCKKCDKKFGLIIEENGEVLCVNCHPIAIGSGLTLSEVAKKIQNARIFKNLERYNALVAEN